MDLEIFDVAPLIGSRIEAEKAYLIIGAPNAGYTVRLAG